jgi:hypothetical protein
LEDVFHTRSQNRSKADYYSKHLFLRILCHELGNPDEPYGESAALGSTLTELPRSDSPVPYDDDDLEMQELGKNDFGDDEKTLHGNSTRKRPLLPTTRSDLGTTRSRASTRPGLKRSPMTQLAAQRDDEAEIRKNRRIEEAAIQALKKGERVNVKVSPMFIFLFRDGEKAPFLFYFIACSLPRQVPSSLCTRPQISS